MTAGRMVREGWIDSDHINGLTWPSECFFLRLILRADDFGRMTADLRMLRASLYPLKLDQVREADVARWIAECVNANLVRPYEVDGKRYFVIPNFKQRMRAKKSKYPAPPQSLSDDSSQRFDESPTDVREPLTDSRGVRLEEEEEGEVEVEVEVEEEGRAPCGGGMLPFNSLDFRSAWKRFKAHRKEIRKPLRPTGEKALLADLAKHQEADVVAALEKSMAAGWPGVYFNGNGHKPPPLVGSHAAPPPALSWRDAGAPPAVRAAGERVVAGAQQDGDWQLVDAYQRGIA